MNKVVAILLFVTLWSGSLRSTATHPPLQNLHAQQNPDGARPIHGSKELGLIVGDESADGSSSSGPMEEESEDDDNSSKEHAVGKMSSFYLTNILQQLHLRQNALFKEYHLEIAVLPPRC